MAGTKRRLQVPAFLIIALSYSQLFAGEWITTREGAKLWNPNPQQDETCSWTGKKDANGYATGPGLTVWYQNRQVAEVVAGKLVAGKSDGTLYQFKRSGTASVLYYENGRYVEVTTRPEIDDQVKPTRIATKGEWITSREGAKIWNESPQADETCRWTGRIDSKGFATGDGLVVWYQKSKIVQVSSGKQIAGKSDGISFVASSNGNAWVNFHDDGERYAVKLNLKRAEPVVRSIADVCLEKSDNPRDGKTSSSPDGEVVIVWISKSPPKLTTGEKIGIAAIAAFGLYHALKKNKNAGSSSSSSAQSAGSSQKTPANNGAAFAEGDYVTNRGFFQKWIGRVTAVNGRTYTVRITWADSSSPFYKGKSVDFLDDEFKALSGVSVKAMAQGYK